MMPSMPVMTERQAAFRADYRARISPWYSGLAHVLVIAALGIATIWYCGRHIHDPSWLEWLVVPAAFLGCNIFEWAMHRFLMNRTVKDFMDRKSTRLNSSHRCISYAVFCLKKKK